MIVNNPDTPTLIDTKEVITVCVRIGKTIRNIILKNLPNISAYELNVMCNGIIRIIVYYYERQHEGWYAEELIKTICDKIKE